jgi:hypothetical protein
MRPVAAPHETDAVVCVLAAPILTHNISGPARSQHLEMSRRFVLQAQPIPNVHQLVMTCVLCVDALPEYMTTARGPVPLALPGSPKKSSKKEWSREKTERRRLTPSHPTRRYS